MKRLIIIFIACLVALVLFLVITFNFTANENNDFIQFTIFNSKPGSVLLNILDAMPFIEKYWISFPPTNKFECTGINIRYTPPTLMDASGYLCIGGLKKSEF